MAEAAPGWARRRSILLNEYERVAWELFADRGFRNVTVDEVADAAGVSARTLFRYFQTKEDLLLGYPRRGMAAEVEAITQLEPSDRTLVAAWGAVRDLFVSRPLEAGVLNLWRAAAADAPEVIDRVRGERMHTLHEALMAYTGRSLGVNEADDPRPRVLAGIVMGLEFALVETATRAPETFSAAVAAADAAIAAVDDAAAKLRRRAPLR
jgi:AcrR family transcriptional regulator